MVTTKIVTLPIDSFVETFFALKPKFKMDRLSYKGRASHFWISQEVIIIDGDLVEEEIKKKNLKKRTL